MNYNKHKRYPFIIKIDNNYYQCGNSNRQYKFNIISYSDQEYYGEEHFSQGKPVLSYE